ncbi:MAG: ribosome maturation factor RimP, partial [Candidatus Competibacterales bacterium]|nr:ribosome maturation factor RimP [Candidatus Competibacterales bacterium]
QVSVLLDVEAPLTGDYVLEVSSPGLDRPLFEPAHYQRYAGEQVKLKLLVPRDGRRHFSGRLLGLDDGQVRLDCDLGEIGIPFDQIESGRLVPDFATIGVNKVPMR